MNSSYFCHKCCKGYNTEDSAHHICLAKIALHVSKVKHEVNQDVPILLFGQNQTEAVRYADGSFMGSSVLQII